MHHQESSKEITGNQRRNELEKSTLISNSTTEDVLLLVSFRLNDQQIS